MKTIWYFLMWWRFHRKWDRYLANKYIYRIQFIAESVFALYIVYVIIILILKAKPL